MQTPKTLHANKSHYFLRSDTMIGTLPHRTTRSGCLVEYTINILLRKWSFCEKKISIPDADLLKKLRMVMGMLYFIAGMVVRGWSTLAPK